MRQMNNTDNRFDTNIQHRDTKAIRRQTSALSDERLSFLDGKRLGDVELTIEDGATVRKVRRIIEKRVSQDYWNHHTGSTRKGGHETRHRTANHMKNIYGFVPVGFRYAFA